LGSTSLIEHTESIIHEMIRTTNPGAQPPVLQTIRPSLQELHLVYSSQRQLCPLAVGLMHGLAEHYHEHVDVEEPSCMRRGDPFCSFVIRATAHDTHAPLESAVETSDVAPDGTPFPVLADMQDSSPASIGGYTIVRLLGQGAIGRVYLARDEKLNRDVAIKVLQPAKARDPAATRRFLREGRAAAAIEHPHVMAIHQVGEDHGVPYIVMQRLVGRTLKQARQAAGRLPTAEVLRIGRETAAGLAAAHRQGLVHRDIKPDNIFLQEPDGQVRIIDFGLARPGVHDDIDVTLEGSLVGTPAYMSPERIEGRELDARSDLFGLGVVLYELLTNRLPFEGNSLVSMLAAISRGNPPDLRTLAPAVPEPLAGLVMRLLAHDPSDRPADAATVAAELAAIERGK
jgi:serine/threonine protein kinase